LDESIALLEEYAEKTSEAGLSAWNIDLCAIAAAFLSNVGRPAEAEAWLARCAEAASYATCAMFARPYFSSAVEIAILRGDPISARKNLDALARSGIGDGLRGRAFLRGAEVRLLQLTPDYVCDDQTVAELRDLYEKTKSLMNADSPVLALGEDYRRRGRLHDLRALIADYTQTARRERSPLPSAFEELVKML
jgi:hypothetical protein